MKQILAILMVIYGKYAGAQSGSTGYENKMDSLITHPIVFNSLLTEIKKIDLLFSNRDSVTNTIALTDEWVFICSYKDGWQETYSASHNGSPGMHRQTFNDIRISRSSNTSITTNELAKIFYSYDSVFTKHTNGIVTGSSFRMTKNKKYMVIGMGHCYPNGNQTSWCYSHNYYFKRQQ